MMANSPMYYLEAAGGVLGLEIPGDQDAKH